MHCARVRSGSAATCNRSLLPMLLDPWQRCKLFRLAPAKECHHARIVWQCLSIFTRWPSRFLKAIDAAILAPDPTGCLRQLLPKPTLIIGKTKAQFLVGAFASP